MASNWSVSLGRTDMANLEIYRPGAGRESFNDRLSRISDSCRQSVLWDTSEQR